MSVTPHAARPIIHSAPALRASSPAARPLQAVPPELRQVRPQATPHAEEGFADHLEAAIRLNRSRRDVYDRLSGGKSRSLSNRLITLERLTLPAAYGFDRWAKRYQKQGIPIVKGDFVPMQDVRSPFAPPRWRGVANDQDASRLENWLGDYRKTIRTALGKDDFAGIAQASYDLLKRLDAHEESTQTHWAMTKHLVESLGLAAMNAVDYAAMSQGETHRLSRTFLRFQSLGLLGSISLDRKAQALHQKGIGILVNDIPHIPFAQRWESRKNGQVN